MSKARTTSKAWHQTYLIPETRTANTSLLSSDSGKYLTYTTGNFSISLPNPTTLFNGYFFYISNSSASNITLTPTSSTINDSSSLVIVPTEIYIVCTDTTAYYAVQVNDTTHVKTLATDATLSGGGLLDSDKTLTFANQTGPCVLGRTDTSSGAMSAVSTPMLDVITAANASAAATVAGVSSLTYKKIQNVTAQASTTIDLSLGHVINLTHGVNITTLTFSNVPSVCEVIICRTKDNSYTDRTITWPTGVSWNEGIAPTLSTVPNSVGYVYLTTIDGGVSWKGLFSSFNAAGVLFTWGNNDFGQLGLGDIVPRSSPVQVGNLTNWAKINCGARSSFAIKTDGTLWGWGTNFYGCLGLGDMADRSSPIQIGSSNNWAFVCSNYHTIAVKTDGTLWGWGFNNYGQLGLGSTTHRSNPVQIGALSTWASVSCNSYHTIALKTDGTLWGWGINDYGVLGLSDQVHRSSPVQVGNLTNWSKVSSGDRFVIAIKTDGTLWGWGFNFYGQLGLGDINNRSSPVQIGSLNNWKNVTCNELSSIALKMDGTIWSWGYNDYGQLGLGDMTPRSSPVQVTGVDWAILNNSSLYKTPIVIKTNKILWGWGNNGHGQLGLGDIDYRVTPVQIGNSTNWNSVSCGSLFTAAIQK